MLTGALDPLRVRAVNDAPVRGDRDYVLYWCVAARRTRWSFALDRAIAHARALGRGLVVLDALRIGYPYASVRLHTFALQGVEDSHARYARAPVTHYRYVERAPDAGKGLLAALAARACVVVTDEVPIPFLARMVAAAGRRLEVRLEAVDGNGLVPLAAAEKEYRRAFDFRRALPSLLGADAPTADPLAGLALPRVEVPAAVRERWPEGPVDPRAVTRGLPIDDLAPVAARGGEEAARAALRSFLSRIERYAEGRDHPDEQATSGLSPWLHWGHLSAHEVVHAVVEAAPGEVGPFGVTASAAVFLDQLVTWRELSLHTAHRRPDAGSYGSLPGWAQRTLAAHTADLREALYDRDTLAAAATADPVWNAAQRQLLTDGTIHNHLRMLWGKRVLAWTETPEEAFAALFELNDRYAIDGRDPNSVSGITWCFGRYDRPWPTRPIYGSVRVMTSASARRKLRLKEYLRRWGS